MIKSVKVGGLKFRVKRTKRMRNAEGIRLIGEANYATQTIKLDSKQEEDAKRVTLLHEVVHLIMARSGLDHTYGPETLEQLCDVFGYAFLDLVRDNPKLIKYLRG